MGSIGLTLLNLRFLLIISINLSNYDARRDYVEILEFIKENKVCRIISNSWVSLNYLEENVEPFRGRINDSINEIYLIFFYSKEPFLDRAYFEDYIIINSTGE